MGMGEVQRTATAGRLLRALLRHEPYRDQWLPYQRRGADDAPNQSAVAQVIALYLWDSGLRPESQVTLARKLKDRINRALKGEVLSAETLNWFIEAFQMSAADTRRLRMARFAPAQGAYVLTEPVNPPIVDSLRVPQYVPVTQRHRTVAVFEHRLIGPDGRVTRHRTMRAILAREDGVDSFPCRLFPGATDVEVRHGGHVARRSEFAGSTPVVEIALSAPLRAGQVASLEYDVLFADDPGQSVEYRRVAHVRAENVDIRVQFDQRPEQIWWTVWDDYQNGEIVYTEPAALDVDDCAHRYVPYLENSAAGFRWVF